MKAKNKKNPLLNYIYFGLDMFEFNLEDLKSDFTFYNDLVWELDQDNTPVGYIELFNTIFSYEKIKIQGYGDGLKFSTSVDGIPIPCFSLLHGKELKFNGKVGKSKDKVVLYSSFFVIDSLKKLDFTIIEFVGTLFNYHNANLYRLDACLDVPYTIKELSPLFIDLKKPSSAIGTDKKHPEFYQTYYLGEIQNSKNRYSLIRIYDKVLDSFKKQKSFLYPHLQNNSDVRRIELELRPEQAKRFANYCILDLLKNKENVISSIFVEFINKKIPKEYHLEGSYLNTIIFEKKKFDLKNTFLKLGHIPKDYLSRVNGYFKTLYITTGFDGLLQAIFNLQYVESFNIKNKKPILGTSPNYEFIKEFFINTIKYLIKKNIFTEKDIIRFVKSALPNSDLKLKTKINLKK